jgi:hypothetical protein
MGLLKHIFLQKTRSLWLATFHFLGLERLNILSRVWLQTGFGFVTRFIDRFNTRLVTTFNYSAITCIHTLQITRAHAKSSQFAVTSRFLVTNLNNGDSSASMLTSLPAGYCSTTELLLQTVLLITSRHRPLIKHRSSLLKFSFCLLRICGLVASVVSLFLSWSFN